MSSDIVYQTIRDWMTANWTACPVAYENEPFTPPAPTKYPAAPACWIQVEFTGDSYEQASLGSGAPAAERWIETGEILFHFLVQTNGGTAAPRAHARALAENLRGLRFANGTRLNSMSIGDAGPGDLDGKWWSITLRAFWARG
jgi:hypothetical protein